MSPVFVALFCTTFNDGECLLIDYFCKLKK
nr:MAG TPA: hypothetical protein [Caudoviricetes sp.]DAU34221.1 MAG TPA: hypothetical protein [Bacteriophage sp.]